jgi:membrane-associated protease RseP (regulator of RpoE activity)
MLLLRLVTTSLCAACFVLLVTFKPVQVVIPESAPAQPGPSVLERSQPLTVIDVVAGVTAQQLGELLRLHSGERIVAVNDHRLGADIAPASAIAELPPAPGGFIDLTVAGYTAERRVLVLLH